MINARRLTALPETPRLHARTRTALPARRDQTSAQPVSLDSRRSRSGLRALCQPDGAPGSHCLTGVEAHQHTTRW